MILRDFRFHLEKTQIEMAELLGCDQAKLSRIENGKYSLYDILKRYIELGLFDFIRGSYGETNKQGSASAEHRHSEIGEDGESCTCERS